MIAKKAINHLRNMSSSEADLSANHGQQPKRNFSDQIPTTLTASHHTDASENLAEPAVALALGSPSSLRKVFEMIHLNKYSFNS